MYPPKSMNNFNIVQLTDTNLYNEQNRECTQEFEVLESIYKEIEIIPEVNDGDSLVTILLYPKSAGNAESRYVTVKLELFLSSTYPTTLPKVVMRNPRGLSEEQLMELENTLDRMRNEFVGSPMLFQLIDYVQDYLTLNNRPSSECPICLMSFTDFDVFYTPACFHHYHSHCLGLHLDTLVNGKKEKFDSQVPTSPVEILCPVCRVGLDPDIDIAKLLASPPADDGTAISSVEPIGMSQPDRCKLDALYQKQKEQGGIIDLNEGCIRLLRISDSTVGLLPQGQLQSQAEPEAISVKSGGGSADKPNASQVSGNSVAQRQGGGGRSSGNHGGGARLKTGHGHYHYHRRSHRGYSSGASRGSDAGDSNDHHVQRYHPSRQDQVAQPQSHHPVRGGRSQHSQAKGLVVSNEGHAGTGSVGSPTSRRKQVRK